MNVSLIICSKNGGNRLSNCLAAVDNLDAPPDMELFLVDNGSTDGVSLAAMEAHRDRSPFKCVVLQTSIPGNSAGRNVAIREASGDILLFVDDDCYVDRRFVHDWLKVFEDSDIGFASGIIRPYNLANSTMGTNEQTTDELVPAGGFVRRGLIQGSNMAFRKNCLDAVGLFDERFGAGTPYAGEEWDVALRASFLGWRGGYFALPVVSHDHGRSKDVARERLLYYDYGAGAVYAKNLKGRHFTSVLWGALVDMFALVPRPSCLVALFSGFVAFTKQAKSRIPA